MLTAKSPRSKKRFDRQVTAVEKKDLTAKSPRSKKFDRQVTAVEKKKIDRQVTAVVCIVFSADVVVMITLPEAVVDDATAEHDEASEAVWRQKQHVRADHRGGPSAVLARDRW